VLPAILLVLAVGLYLLWSGATDAPRDAVDVRRGDHAERADEPMLVGAPEPAASEHVTEAPSREAPTPEPPSEPSAAVIRGVVVDGSGRPQPSMEVELRSRPATWTTRVSTDRSGRFEFASTSTPVPDDLELVVRPSGDTVHRPHVRSVQPGDDVRIVLEPYPYVVLELVDAVTGRGLRSGFVQVVHRHEDDESPQAQSTRARVPEDPEPFRHVWVVRTQRDAKTTIQVRAQGYEPSPWIDAPTAPEHEPRRIAMRADPLSIGTLVATIRTDDGTTLTQIVPARLYGDGGSSGWSGWVLEGGRIVLLLEPGQHRIRLGGRGIGLPEEAHEWYVPETLDLEIGRGQTVDREVLLRRGGFVRLPEVERDVTFTNGEETFPFPSHSDNLFGPLPPGPWRYTFSRDGRAYAGTVEVVAGEIATPEPQAVEDEVAGR
jgi:hypothetical protein